MNRTLALEVGSKSVTTLPPWPRELKSSVSGYVIVFDELCGGIVI